MCFASLSLRPGSLGRPFSAYTMIKYSHVSLWIPCAADTAASVTHALGVQPTRIREEKVYSGGVGIPRERRIHFTWMLDSPKSHADGDPTVRLYALADVIEPIASRLGALRPEFSPWVDVMYHLTPQHPHGVTGEFDWLRMPAELMRRYASWDLDVSYETFWFDHPDWIRPKPRGFWSTMLGRLADR